MQLLALSATVASTSPAGRPSPAGPRAPTAVPVPIVGTADREEKAMPEIKDITEEISKTARDAAYVVVGLGVLGFQRAQVRRQELAKRLADPRAQVESALEDVRHQLTERVKDVDGRIEQAITRLEETWEPVEQRLPAQARSLVEQARARPARRASSCVRSSSPTPPDHRSPEPGSPTRVCPDRRPLRGPSARRGICWPGRGLGRVRARAAPIRQARRRGTGRQGRQAPSLWRHGACPERRTGRGRPRAARVRDPQRARVLPRRAPPYG